jgi:co-chaperonin GroES (HSP10)
MNIKPLGFYVLIEMIEIQKKSAGGIILDAKDVDRQQEGCDIGYVRDFGNVAFSSFPGCNPADYPPNHVFSSIDAPAIWGIKIGDKVEYRRFEGKVSGVEGNDKLRYIPDSQIIGLVKEDAQ